jgi:methionyl-tRNA formyltransferase
MKIIILANHVYAIPTINFLASKQLLQAVILPDVVQQYNQQVELAVNANKIPCKRFAKKDLKTAFKEWLTQQAPDMVITYTFPYKIPEEVFNIPIYGFFNVHYSLLPAYMGPFPVFWQIKNGDSKGGISIHQMDKDFDTGDVILQQEVPTLLSETQGLYSTRLSIITVNIVFDFINKIFTGQVSKVEPNLDKSYYPKPELKDFTIDWKNQSASEIENLVNACNAEMGGAITTFNGQGMRIVEVSKAIVNGTYNTLPGTIVYSDINNGIYVACKNNEYLKVNIIQMTEGIFSGNKLSSMGVQAGNNFD